MQLTEQQREKLIKAIQTGICCAAFLYSAGSWAKSQTRWKREKKKLNEKQERKLAKEEYKLQKKLLREEYRKKMERK